MLRGAGQGHCPKSLNYLLGQNMFIGSEVPANSWQVKSGLYFLCVVVELRDAQEKKDPESHGVGVLTGQARNGCGYLIRKFTRLKSARNCLDAKAKIEQSPESFNLITHISENQVEFSDGKRRIG